MGEGQEGQSKSDGVMLKQSFPAQMMEEGPGAKKPEKTKRILPWSFQQKPALQHHILDSGDGARLMTSRRPPAMREDVLF